MKILNKKGYLSLLILGVLLFFPVTIHSQGTYKDFRVSILSNQYPNVIDYTSSTEGYFFFSNPLIGNLLLPSEMNPILRAGGPPGPPTDDDEEEYTGDPILTEVPVVDAIYVLASLTLAYGFFQRKRTRDRSKKKDK